MANLNKAITQASKILISAIEVESPETDCRLLPRKINELVKSSISVQTASNVQVTASMASPSLCVSADGLACAHAMYVTGDKTNALRMVMYAFEQPDCARLMTTLSELNEEVDPSDLDNVFARINKGEMDNSDLDGVDDDGIVFGDEMEIPPAHVDPDDAHVDALVGNPAAEIDAIQDQDLNWPDSGAPYADYSTYDFLNQGQPPDSIQVLQDVLSNDYDENSLYSQVTADIRWQKHNDNYLQARSNGAKAVAFKSGKNSRKPYHAKVVDKDGNVLYDAFHASMKEAKINAENKLKVHAVLAASKLNWHRKFAKSDSGEKTPYIAAEHRGIKAAIFHDRTRRVAKAYYARVTKDGSRLHHGYHESLHAAKAAIESVVHSHTVRANYESFADGNMTNLSEDLGDEDYGGNNNVIDSGYSDNYSFSLPFEDDNTEGNTFPVESSDDLNWERKKSQGGDKYLKATQGKYKAFILPGIHYEHCVEVYHGKKRIHVSLHNSMTEAKNKVLEAIKNHSVKAEADVVPGYDDNQLSNVSTDPATDVDWNPANWDLDDDLPTRGDPMNFDFDDMAAVNPGMTDLNGIDNTVAGNPSNESDTGALDQQFGLIPSLNPSQSIIAKITDKKVLAAINIMSAKNTPDAKSKLNAFINMYCAKNNIK